MLFPNNENRNDAFPDNENQTDEKKNIFSNKIVAF